VDLREWICVLLIFHAVLPPTRILLLVPGPSGEFKVLADGNTIIDGGLAAICGLRSGMIDRRSSKATA
jgi:hypothetical protein